MNKIKTTLLGLGAALAIFVGFTNSAYAAPDVKSKFYDFSDQLINGQILKPSITFYSAREKVRFNRLLRIRRDFMGRELQRTARDRVFK